MCCFIFFGEKVWLTWKYDLYESMTYMKVWLTWKYDLHESMTYMKVWLTLWEIDLNVN